MEAAQGEEQTIENLTRRVLAVNFAAIQASSVVNPNLYLHIIPYTQLIEGIPDIRAYPLLFGRPTRIHWASSRRSRRGHRTQGLDQRGFGSDVQSRQFHQGVAAKDSVGKS